MKKKKKRKKKKEKGRKVVDGLLNPPYYRKGKKGKVAL